MLQVNGTEIKQETFGDNSLKLDVNSFLSDDLCINHLYNIYNIDWFYENDAEIFTLYSIVRTIRDCSASNPYIFLFVPYLPHARQDRFVSERAFTLKYFAELINSMRFDKVRTMDVHSDVASALIDNLEDSTFQGIPPIYKRVLKEKCSIMFPDAGAAKRFSATEDDIIGFKTRDENGRIKSFDLLNFTPGTKEVLIVDDICSYGGTFVAAAKELRNRGVEKVYLAVTHCENNILKGEVFDWIDKVYTTDSICTIEHPKLHITNIR